MPARGQPKASKPKEADANLEAFPSAWPSPKKAAGKWNSK